jgi:hypothetical protein
VLTASTINDDAGNKPKDSYLQEYSFPLMSHQRERSRERNEARLCLQVEGVGGIEEECTEREDDDMR